MFLTDYVPVNSAGSTVIGQGILQESQKKNGPLGTKVELNDGRIFRYAYNGGVALTPGKLVQTPAWVSTETALVATASSLGDKIVNVICGSNFGAADVFADGYLGIENASAGLGCYYKIKTHPDSGSNYASVAIPFTLYDPVRVATTGTVHACLIKNPYSAVVVSVANGSPQTGKTIGVPIIPVNINYYCWIQTKGPCMVLCDGTPAVNDSVMVGSVPGSVALLAGTHYYAGIVGMMMHTGVNSEYRPVFLSLE